MNYSGYTIFAPGFAKWWGSDARALGQALRSLGHTVLDIDEEDYISWRPQGIGSKLIRRLFGRVYTQDYNKAVLRQASDSAFDFVLAFKGNSLTPETIQDLRDSGKPVYNFYPDVSFHDHGPNIPQSLKLYDCVFTTKTYHGEREIKRYGIRELKHVRHGFDPEVHRPISLTPQLKEHYGCDVSFVGCWSQFKGRLGRNLKRGVFGDELSLVYCASKINLGLLSCSSSDPAARDQTTARSFQIPATRSLLLHEDTAEIRSYFDDMKEVLLFSDNDEMVDKIEWALQSPAMRAEIQRQGYERCQSEPYDYSKAANEIIESFENASNGTDSITERLAISERTALEPVY